MSSRGSGFPLDARLDPHVQRVDRTSDRPSGEIAVVRPADREPRPQQRHVGRTLLGYGQRDVRPGERRVRRRRRRGQRVGAGRRHGQQQVTAATLGGRGRSAGRLRVGGSRLWRLVRRRRRRRRRLPVRELLRRLTAGGGVRVAVRRRPLRRAAAAPHAVPTCHLRPIPKNDTTNEYTS